MDNYQTFKIDSHFPISVKATSRKMELSDYEKNLVDAIWEKEAERCQDRLFNGQILSAISWDRTHLLGEFIEYKHYLAQKREPQLRAAFAILPVAISGLTYLGEKILIGQRAENVAHHPFLYELAPSGGIDPSALEGDHIIIEKQVKLELKEETGIQEDLVDRIEPFALIYDEKQKNLELCVDIFVDPHIVDFSSFPKDEYTQLLWVPIEGLATFMVQHEKSIIPFSKYLLQVKGFL